MSGPVSALDRLHAAMDPGRIRSILNVFHEERERFVPRMLSTSSFEEMLDELARFYIAAQERWYTAPGVHGMDRARFEVLGIIDRKLADGSQPNSGRYHAMYLAASGARGGMVHLLDIIADTLIETGLNTYFQNVVMPIVHGLSAPELMAVMETYAGEIAGPLGGRADSPASLALRARQILHQHLEDTFRGSAGHRAAGRGGRG